MFIVYVQLLNFTNMLKYITSTTIIALTLASHSINAQSFKADPNKSTINWVGKKVTGQHTGNVKLASGSVTLNGEAIKAGEFVVDMTSINVTDLEGEWRDKLIGHLKNDDFFAVDKFPKASLTILEGKKETNGSYTVKGNLTIKGITKPITFPATIKKDTKGLLATSTITVDRTAYDIRYGSKSFFDNLGDKTIDNEFILTVNLVSVK